MRVVEKSVINELILQGEEYLKAEKRDKAGKWLKDVYAPEIFDNMIVELENLRKRLEERAIEV